MARDDGMGVLLIAGIATFGILYFTKNFCPGGFAPIEGLCYEGEFQEYGEECIGGGCTEDPTYSPIAGPKTRAPTAADKRTCVRGWKKGADSQCHCNRVILKCAANQTAKITGSGSTATCTCATCPAGYKRRALNNNDETCVKVSPGIPSGGSVGCPYGYVRQNGKCNCNRVLKRCAANSVTALDKGWCICKSCPAGYKRGTSSALDNRCLKVAPAAKPSASGVKQNNGKYFIADTINRIIKNCTGRNIGTTNILRGWPSNITRLASLNNYESTYVQNNNRPWAKLYRDTIIAVARAYKLNLNASCTQTMACLNSRSMRECGLIK